jgi:Dolichyl-phosphate-mannose-protein mannosyltransferase
MRGRDMGVANWEQKPPWEQDASSVAVTRPNFAIRSSSRQVPPESTVPGKKSWRTPLGLCLGAGFIVGIAWLIRAIGITTNYDIFIDEVTYTRIANNLATGQGLELYGTPFDLHPPAVFAIYALAIKAFALHGNIETLLFDLRPFVALVGALTCGVVFLLVHGLARWYVGVAAAAMVAFDPFQIYYDSHVMLEAPAQFASVLTICLLAKSLRCESERASWLFTVLGGLGAGLAICAKEYFGLVIVLTLLLALVTGIAIERGKAALALTITLGSYLLAESLVIITSGFQAWWDQVGSGIRRLIGTEQATGFNSATVHVSLVARLSANATHFGITYLILGLGATAALLQVAAVIRLRSQWVKSAGPADRGRLLVALWAMAAVAYLCYATAFGTLEEQMYYLMFTPVLCALVLGVAHAMRKRNLQWRTFISICFVGVVLVTDSAVWSLVHQSPDDEYRQFLAWEPAHVPSGSIIAVTDSTSQFLLTVASSQWSTIPELKHNHVDYVLLSTLLTSQGYGIATPQFEQYLNSHASIVFQANGPSDGELIVYDVRAITGARR